MKFTSFWMIISIFGFTLIANQIPKVQADTWITLWNKLSVPAEIQCLRESAKTTRKFKKKLVEPDDRYDIKGKYPQKSQKKYFRHWCVVTAENTTINFNVFGGKDKRINKLSDSYSDWIINVGGVYRFKKGQLEMYYGKNWLGEEFNIEDDLAGTPEKELHPEDFVFIAPLDIDLKTGKMPLAQQRFAITKATYASHKFSDSISDMARYIKAAMKKKFGSFWEVFIEQKESNRAVKRTCDSKNIMNFSVNELHFIICKVQR